MTKKELETKRQEIDQTIREAVAQKAALTKLIPYEETMSGLIQTQEDKVKAIFEETITLLSETTGKNYIWNFQPEGTEARLNVVTSTFQIARPTKQRNAVHELIAHCKDVGSWEDNEALREWLIDVLNESL